ncbi:hypothetical protein PYCCODRAFT_1397242 [Trametes coccinea BRFM310]|uniref:Protein kinase domain-containing protein n=1 Tax=Trametes coccinea (strain BRFM310) TaxID=1353009 RepID=A0A1Y2ID67_TRAC3|nr:hypothetical protein PYCCODRAFT_1397242 [Trametes coccinea BRFM310]
MSGAPWNIYAEQLEGLQYGFPLWVPDPAPQMKPVELGDVGWVREGEFIPVFNAFRAAEDSQPWEETPDGFVPLSTRGLAFIGPREKIGQTLLCSNSIKQRAASTNLGAGSTTTGPSGNIGFSFLCRDDAGAILSFHPAAMSHEVLAESTIKNYISANFDSWYRFATEVRGFPLREQDLRFVIGTTKSIRWAVAAFRGRYRNKKGVLTGALGAVPGTANMSFTISDQSLPSTHWRIGPPTRTNPRAHHSEALLIEDSKDEALRPYDQCLFIHSVKAKRRLIPRFLKAGAGPHELPRHEDDPRTEQLLSALSEDSDYETDRDSNERAAADGELSDPVDVLLDYILENSDARMAIASDVDLYEILQTQPGWPEDLRSALYTLSPTIIVSNDGVGTAYAVGRNEKSTQHSKVIDESVLASTPTSAEVSVERMLSEYEAIREHVRDALVAVLGKAEDVVQHFPDAAEHMDEPVAPLTEAAQILLQLWVAAQTAQVFRHGCLRLADSCAVMLKAVRDEVVDAGNAADVNLRIPIARLTEAFDQAYKTVIKQSSGTFITGFLKRRVNRQALLSCSDTLENVLSSFNFSLALRVHRQLNDNTPRQDTGPDFGTLLDDSNPSKPPHTTSPAAHINKGLALDDLDIEQELGRAVRAARSESLREFTSILGVTRDEMPEAVRALQGELEASLAKGAQGESLDYLHSEEAPASIGAKKTEQAALIGTPRGETLEFLKASIDVLSKFNRAAPDDLPGWTITRYEIDREELISVGAWSKVYRGTWKGQAVVIKILAEATPRHMFMQQISTWKALHHPHVLELLGASSGYSDPPWHTVHPYYHNGSLVQHIRRIPKENTVDLLCMTLEIAKGMSYLHSQDILHGDLKAENILVDDEGHCVVYNFGQSDMKAEVYRISGIPPFPDSLRWQAPELMSGENGVTFQSDVYAFAITCVEICTHGAVPWPMADDDAVRQTVLGHNERPFLPHNQPWSSGLAGIVSECWARDPAQRPSFVRVEQALGKLHEIFSASTGGSRVQDTDTALLGKYFSSLLTEPMEQGPDRRATISPDPSVSTAAPQRGQEYASSPQSQSHEVHSSVSSPLLEKEHTSDVEDERRYRRFLIHEFNPTLTLPLWSPSKVPIGAVGYHSPSRGGEFIILFDSLNPSKSPEGRAQPIPSLLSYGRINQSKFRQDRRGVAQRGMDMVASWAGISRGQGPARYTRRYLEPLRAGHVATRLFTESTVYRYIEDLATPKKWLRENIDQILALYQEEHSIVKEDVCLVIGTLEAEQYALLVSHEHRNGRASFNVFRSPQAGQPWGEFTFEVDEPSTSADDGRSPHQYAEKVSKYNRGGRWDSVLLARLRFKSDQSEPTVL